MDSLLGKRKEREGEEEIPSGKRVCEHLDFDPQEIRSYPCESSHFKGEWIEEDMSPFPVKWNRTLYLDEENFIYLDSKLLDRDELDSYLQKAARVERISGKSAFGRTKPRKEISYTANGRPNVYSGVAHQTTEFPYHVELISEKMCFSLGYQGAAKTKSWVPDNCNDIVYGPEFKCGGSIGKHADDENPNWCAIGIFSLGQERVMRIRGNDSGRLYNVLLKHNSVVWMVGPTFQKRYTHEVPKLKADETVHTRLSLNIRYVE